MILVTGGSGFIGSAFILQHLRRSDEPIANLDALTYAGNPENLSSIEDDPRYHFIHADIRNRERLNDIFLGLKPRAVVHFAAESHVDRSIAGPDIFFQTNTLGTVNLLEASRKLLALQNGAFLQSFRFLYVSTDEVYGSLGPKDPPFTEMTPLSPRSPYSASKASGDTACHAWGSTYGIPILITHCSNNFGPRQFPEKLIPFMIVKILSGLPVPIYGDGLNIRDWLFVEDHCEAISTVLAKGAPGEIYNIGGNAEKTNLEIFHTVAAELRRQCPTLTSAAYQFVTDRPGHDRRYAINTEKIRRELGWSPQWTFEEGIKATVDWYLKNPVWLRHAAERAIAASETLRNTP